MDTLFHLRKFIQAVLLNPALVLLAVVLVGTVRASLKKRPPSRWVVASALALVIPLFVPIANFITEPLEGRFPRLRAADIADADVIVVLGGCIRGRQSENMREPSLTEASERITTGVKLAHLFPAQTLLFTSYPIETKWAGVFFREMGIDPERVVLDSSAWTTVGNAESVAALVDPKTTSVVLVTSARHMPRSIGAFRELGFRDLRPFPTDFQAPYLSLTDVSGHWTRITGAIHEWVGLFVYWVSDESSELFPAPA